MNELLEAIRFVTTLPEDERAVLLLVAERPRAAAELRAALKWRRVRVARALVWLLSRGWISKIEQHNNANEDQVYELAPRVLQRLGLEGAPWTPEPIEIDVHKRAREAHLAHARAAAELQRTQLALMEALAELPSCDDCPIGGRDGEGSPCLRAPLCDAECAQHSAVWASECAGEAIGAHLEDAP